MGYTIGLDIGISSVGWGIISDNGDVIDLGTRLFSEADASKNEARRNQRGARRLNRRKIHRLERLNKLLENHGIVNIEKCKENPLIIRNKGLEQKLVKEELGIALRHIMKHRGISYLDDAIEEGDAKSEYQKALLNNEKALMDKLPCQIQLERYERMGGYRGDKIIDDTAYSNVFTKSAYIKEINLLLETQSQYHEFVDEGFIEEYLNIFISKREYYDGPGNEKSRTDYGKYTTNINEKGEYHTLDNIFEKLIGKCSIYKEELRASSGSYTAEEYNVLNDLNNITVNGRKLQENEKRKIIEIIKNEKSVNMRKIIKNVLNEDIEDLKGARVDKEDKEIFHTFEVYKGMKKKLEEVNVNIEEIDRQTLDKIAYILTLNTDKESILKAFESQKVVLNDEAKECLINYRKSNGKKLKWHAFSLKIMNELIPIMYEQSKEQMQILTELGKFKTNIENYKQYKHIPANIIAEEIYNPIVKKSVTQSIKVLNKIIEKYGEPSEIVVEMARDENGEEKKKRIQKMQNDNEKELNKIITKIEDEYNVLITESDFHKHKKLKTTLRLWNEQNGVCLYSGKYINPSDLICNYNMFEIDHIIPISISFDDSRNNKVLVYKSENQLKGNKTPYMYLSGVQREWNLEKYEANINDLFKKKQISYKKRNNLLFKESITKQEVVQGFISRNLNDTRYSARTVLNTLQGYMKAHEKETKIKVVNGLFTGQMRKKLRLSKNRDESYAHHAIDALIICYSQMGLSNYKTYRKDIINYETGEILDCEAYYNMSDEETYEREAIYNNLMQTNKKLVQAEKRVKYSHKVDKKVNRQVANETIYGVREKSDGKKYKISKIKDIYDIAEYDKFKKKYDKNKLDDFLMYNNDKKTFEKLLNIVELYKDAKNPFLAYKEDIGEPIRKYSKKDDGPFITSLKYYDGEVGSHIDISNKYGHKKGDMKVVLDSLNPYRADVFYNTEKNTYHIAGIKYADFQFVKGKYIIKDEIYNEILKREKLLKDGQEYKNINDYGYNFLFSLYKNDIILYEKDGVEYEERFLSRTMPKAMNYIETKPIYAGNFEKQNQIGLTKATKIVKVNTDLLGNKNYTKKEKFSLKFSLDMK